jgi:predicted ester cyclase
MSSDTTTGSDDAATEAGGRIDPAEGSRRLLEETFNEGNLGLIDHLVAPDAVNHDPAEPAHIRALRGPEVLKRTVQMYRAAFPDVRITVDDVIASGEKVAIRWHSEGTHRGELEGLAPTGVRGGVTGISIDQWKDGKRKRCAFSHGPCARVSKRLKVGVDSTAAHAGTHTRGGQESKSLFQTAAHWASRSGAVRPPERLTPFLSARRGASAGLQLFIG